jgi:hypothetical protein
MNFFCRVQGLSNMKRDLRPCAECGACLCMLCNHGWSSDYHIGVIKPSNMMDINIDFLRACNVVLQYTNIDVFFPAGNVYYGTAGGQPCVVKCPVLDEFALKLFDTERAVNIKLNKASEGLSVPWAKMLGEINIPGKVGCMRQLDQWEPPVPKH